MKDNPFVTSIVKFFKRHEILGGLSMYSFIMPIMPVLIFYNGEYKSLFEVIIIFMPLWLLILSLRVKNGKLAPLFFTVYIVWGTIYAVNSFDGVPPVWIIYIVSIIISIFSAINIAYSK